VAKKKTSKIHLVVVLTLLIIVVFFGYQYFTSQERQRAEASLFPVSGVLKEDKIGCKYSDPEGNTQVLVGAPKIPVMTMHTGDVVLTHLPDHEPYLDQMIISFAGQDLVFNFGNISYKQLKLLAKYYPIIAATARQSEDVVKVLKIFFPFQMDNLEEVYVGYEDKYYELADVQEHNIKTIKSYIGGHTYKDLEKQMADIERVFEEIDDQIAFLKKEEGKFLSFLDGSIYCDDINIDAS
jgi:hypothetical protein